MGTYTYVCMGTFSYAVTGVSRGCATASYAVFMGAYRDARTGVHK